jgi:hypothetical protein
VSDASLLRLIEVVKRDLGASDARIEIGGEPPPEDQTVCIALRNGWRLVAVVPPEGDGEEQRERMTSLADAFTGVLQQTYRNAPAGHPESALAVELAALAERCEALAAVVIDTRSPVLWGSSHSGLAIGSDVDHMCRAGSAVELALDSHSWQQVCELGARGVSDALRSESNDDSHTEAAARLAAVASGLAEESDWEREARLAAAVAQVRRKTPGHETAVAVGRLIERGEAFGYLAHPAADVYWLVVVLDGAFSEIAVEGAVRKAEPRIQRLIETLPPVDPPPKGGKVVRLDTRRPGH